VSQTITVSAKPYEDYDDCLSAAAEDISEELGLAGYDLDPRWVDNDRDSIRLTIPDWAERLIASGLS
jgi:hypothetical protein